MRDLRTRSVWVAWCALLALGCGGSPAAQSDAAVREPQKHRAAGATCPSGRAAGTVCTNLESATTGACQVDGDCTAATNGRCFSPPIPSADCSPTACSYDQCQSDSDCPTHVPCECRDSALSSSANACATGGNCATDADCGPRGFCSPGAYISLCSTPIYFCHTDADTCLDDSDCPRSADGSTVGSLQACAYDSQAGHFACSEACIPPP